MNSIEVVEAWRNGQTVKSIAMGGLSDGYEIAIQSMGFEMLAEMESNKMDWSAYDAMTVDERRKAWGDYREKIEASESVKKIVDEVGPSGAQYGAAINMAYVFSKNGYEKGLAMAPADRVILVSKTNVSTPKR